jgi:hypothetical protein
MPGRHLWITLGPLGTIGLTLAGSAILNGLAFGLAVSGLLANPAAALGVAIPGLIFALSKVAAALILNHR